MKMMKSTWAQIKFIDFYVNQKKNDATDGNDW